MLEKILIQNFQKHEKLRIDFDPAVTAIVGPSDAGKSSVIRALRWVATNQPQGDAFIRDGSKGCTVQLTVDGRTIGRRRGAKRNEYRLDDQEFRAFGIDVPDPVAKILNVSEINWQGQHDAAFWLSSSAGEVSRQLNAVVDLTVIDDALSNIATEHRRALARVDATKERLDKAKDKRKSVEWVDDASADFQKVEDAETKSNELTRDLARMTRLVADVESIAETKRTAQAAAQALSGVVSAGTDAVELTTRRELLHGLVETAERLESTPTPPDIEPLQDAKDRVVDAYKNRLNFDRFCQSMMGVKINAEDAAKKADRLDAKLMEAIDGRCPVCGGEMVG